MHKENMLETDSDLQKAEESPTEHAPSKSRRLPTVSEDVWYSEGLRFKCTGCGKCCTGFPGAVWVSDEEVRKIADHLKETVQEVEEKYTRLIGDKERRSLKEVGRQYDCVFLVDKKFCRIYEARPTQCQTYPWWDSLLESRSSWEEGKAICEGIEHPDAPLIERSAIEEMRRG